jgi:hypothetical protein
MLKREIQLDSGLYLLWIPAVTQALGTKQTSDEYSLNK